nr:MAG TPA: hypothetical protein [Caudoviricetes sp.]
MANLNELKKKYNLDIIKVGENGVAESEALVGFSSIEQAREIAEAEGLVLGEYMSENNTSEVYVNTGETPRFEYNVLAQYEDFTRFCNEDADEFQKIDIDERLENEDFSEEEKEEFLKNMNIVKERIKNLADNEFIYIDNGGCYSEAIKETDMGTIINGDYYIIGAQ